MMMRHRQIPPQISLKNLNPKVKALGNDGARIDPNGTAWQQQRQRGHTQPRTALLHNVGAAGSNVAMAVREYNEPQRALTMKESDDDLTYMLGISGKTAKVASKLRDDLIAYLIETTDVEVSVPDLCYTMTARRQLYGHRIAVTGNSVPQLVQNLRNAEPRHAANQKSVKNQVVFVFSGQGAQYLGMGQQLLSMYPIFSQTIHKVDGILTANGFPGCLDIISPSTATTETTNFEDAHQIQAFQSAIFALEVALAQLLASWGVAPGAVVGHSLGEYAALVTAGVLDITSGTLLVARRAQLLVTKCELSTTSMLAVNLSASSVRLILEEHDRFSELEISCDNSPGDCVVGGAVPHLEQLKQYLTTTYTAKSKFLEVPMAYHTRALDPIISDLKQYACTLRLGRPTVPVISTVLGRTVDAGEDGVFTPEYFAQHSRDTVSFHQAMTSFSSTLESSDTQTTHWVEVGPHASLLPMIKSQIPSTPVGLLSCLRKGVNPSMTMSQLMKHFYENSISIDWRQAFKFHDQPRFITLPGLPFFQTEFVISYPHESADRFANKIDDAHPSPPSNVFLGRMVQKATDGNGFTGIYETPVQSLGKFITGHMVCGYALCPASVYHQMALSAVRDMASSSGNLEEAAWSLTDVEYVGPLLYTEQSTALARTVVSSLGGSRDHFSFEVSSYTGPAANSSQGQIHCRGLLKNKSCKSRDKKYNRMTQVMDRQITRLAGSTDPNTVVETFSTRAMYDSIFTRVVTYSKPYQLVQFIRISPDYGEAHARCRVPSDTVSDRSAASSIFMDVLLHVAGFVANMSVENTVACICKEVSSALVLREPVTPGAYFDVCCILTTDDSAGHIIADAQASDENGFMASFKGMVFQQVQLNKISKAFDIAARRISHGTSSPLSSVPPSLTHTTPPLSKPRSHLNVVPADSAPGIKDISLLEPSQTSANIRAVIAQTCGSDPSTLSLDAKLEELGFDSLLLIELEGQLVSVYPGVTSISIAECVTVRDVERLCAGQQTPDTPSSPASTSIVPIDDTAADNQVLDVQRMTMLIIAETCSADPSAIDLNSELVALGIDSLMFYELESSLLSLCKDVNVSTSQLSECRTVGDVERLVSLLNL